MTAEGEAVFSRMCGELITDYRFGVDVAVAIYEAMETARRDGFRERIVSGRERARAEGKMRGRRSIVDLERLKTLAAEFNSVKKAAEEMGISRVTAWRLLRADKIAETATTP